MCRKLWPTYRTSKSLRIKSVVYFRLLQQVCVRSPLGKSQGPPGHWVQHHDHDFRILWAHTRASWHHEPFLCSTSFGRCLTAHSNLIQDSSSAGKSERSLAYSARNPSVKSDDSFLSGAEAISTVGFAKQPVPAAMIENGQHAVAKSVKSCQIQSNPISAAQLEALDVYIKKKKIVLIFYILARNTVIYHAVARILTPAGSNITLWQKTLARWCWCWPRLVVKWMKKTNRERISTI